MYDTHILPKIQNRGFRNSNYLAEKETTSALEDFVKLPSVWMAKRINPTGWPKNDNFSYLEPTLLMWPWWVKIPTEYFTGVSLAIGDTYGDDVREIVVLLMEVDKVVDEVTDMEIDK